MHFEQGHLYHVYNQGNNKQKIFFNRENYLYFTQKIRTHILPYADIVAWCLMPNHFHLMLRVHTELVPTHQMTINDISFINDDYSHQMSKQKLNSNNISLINDNYSNQMSKTDQELSKTKTLTDSIAIMLRSYTRAINKQQKTTGNLFRQKTKALCLTESKGVTPAFYNTKAGTLINVSNPEREYPKICFNYIHQNPVQGKLVTHITDWEFSSAQDYAEIRSGTLINKNVAKEFELV